MKILWKGKEYPEITEIPGGVVAKIEREIECDIDGWRRMDGMLAFIFASVWVVDRDAIAWRELEMLGVEAINACYLEEPGDKHKAPLDHKPPVKKAAARKSAPRKRPSTRRAAADSSTSESTST